MTGIIVEPLSDADREWSNSWIADNWGSTFMVSNGVLHDLTTAPGVVAWVEGGRAGLLNYNIVGDQFEITLLFSVLEGIGVGSALVDAAIAGARDLGCRRMWVVTTNDNTHAIRFYQRRGMTLAAVRFNELERARQLKPQIPLTGIDDIPLRDELEFELWL